MNPENNLSTKEAALLKLKQKRTKPFGLGQFGGGGAGTQFSPIQEEQFELKKDTLWVPVQQSYNEAFANARKKGLKTFMFNGELKTTELGDDPKAQEAGSKRMQQIGLIPIEYTKKVKKETDKKEKGGSITTFKKPAGPLKPSRNWDKTLTGKLINFSENPDSIGWDDKNRRWYAPPAGKGYDTNQFGMGVDRNQTPGFRERVKRDSKGREYLTENDERYLRHMAIDRANESANTRYQYAQRTTKTKGAVSPKHDAITVSAIYNLGPGHIARTIFENAKAMKALFNRNSPEYQKAVQQQYRNKNRNQRIVNENKFFKQNGL